MMILLAIAENTGIDKEKFEEVYYRYKDLMYYVSYEILRDESLAQDAVQRSFLKIIKIFNEINLEKCNKTRNLFVIISKNVSLDMYRTMKSKGEFDFADFELEDIKDHSSEIEYDNIENVVEEAIKDLPDIFSDIMYLKYIHDYSNKEISKLLNIKEGTLRQRLVRGKEKLRQILKEKGVEKKKKKKI